MNKRTKVMAAAIFVFAGLISSTGAYATPIAPTGSTVITKEVRNQDCVEALTKIGATDQITSQCDEKITIQSGPGVPVSKADLLSLQGIMTTQSLSAFATSAAPMYKDFSFDMSTGAISISMKGRAYYDYTRVWVTQLVSGKRGSLACVVNLAVGFDATNTSCTDTGTNYVRTITGRYHYVMLGNLASWDSLYVGHIDDTGYIY
jgi:hypothetical protein